MIENDTVLILGAGASCPYGLPSAQLLKDEICLSLAGGRVKRRVSLRESLIGCGLASADVEAFGRGLAESDLGSVDLFLEHHREFEAVGKAAIAYILLWYERADRLGQWFRDQRVYKWRREFGYAEEDKRFDEKKEYSSWYQFLWTEYLYTRGFERFKDNRLAIVTFNYDRSLEQFLFNQVESTYAGRESSEYEKAVNAIPVVHLYGSLGCLPWQSGDGDAVGYVGGGKKPATIMAASRNIKIMHEGRDTEEDKEFKLAWELLGRAKQVCILGFGYEQTNLERLRLDSVLGREGKPAVSGTAFNIPLVREEVLKGLRLNSETGGIKLYKTRIYDFLHDVVTLA